MLHMIGDFFVLDEFLVCLLKIFLALGTNSFADVAQVPAAEVPEFHELHLHTAQSKVAGCNRAGSDVLEAVLLLFLFIARDKPSDNLDELGDETDQHQCGDEVEYGVEHCNAVGERSHEGCTHSIISKCKIDGNRVGEAKGLHGNADEFQEGVEEDQRQHHSNEIEEEVGAGSPLGTHIGD